MHVGSNCSLAIDHMVTPSLYVRDPKNGNKWHFMELHGNDSLIPLLRGQRSGSAQQPQWRWFGISVLLKDTSADGLLADSQIRTSEQLPWSRARIASSFCFASNQPYDYASVCCMGPTAPWRPWLLTAAQQCGCVRLCACVCMCVRACVCVRAAAAAHMASLSLFIVCWVVSACSSHCTDGANEPRPLTAAEIRTRSVCSCHPPSPLILYNNNLIWYPYSYRVYSFLYLFRSAMNMF